MKHHPESIHHSVYPFAAVVGSETAKRALLLLAIDPGLRGVLISGSSGSAKRVLARSFASLTSGVDGAIGTPFVELPTNAADDALLGGLDLEATVASGERCVSRGMLARAHGGVLYSGCVNLLDAALADHIAATLEDGIVRLERDGISESFRARFVFVGTGDSAQGEISPNLRDRVGLLVEMGDDKSASEGAEIIERAIEFDREPEAFVETWAIETAAIRSQIDEARERLLRISIEREDISRLAVAAMSLGVEGNRADIFAARAARSSAALAGRDSIADEDLVLAIKLVLLPRATQLPPSAPQQSELEPRPEVESRENPDTAEREPNETTHNHEINNGIAEDLIIEAIAAQPPTEALILKGGDKNTGGTRAGSGRRAQTEESSRGRYTGARRIRVDGARIAVDATLRAAAPYQVARRARRKSASSRRESTLRKSLVEIVQDDLRFKCFKRRSGVLFIFAVDASGSMAVNRMAQAKGAIARLLGEAYLHRDKVALISFRGSNADILLAPTRSVELAKQLVDAMPTGGGTPIGAGLLKALGLARLARLQGIRRAVILLMTDGRGNVAARARGSGPIHPWDAVDELAEIGAVLAGERIESVVIDTRSSFVSSGEADRLAKRIGARYLYLPRRDIDTMNAAVADVAAQLRN